MAQKRKNQSKSKKSCGRQPTAQLSTSTVEKLDFQPNQAQKQKEKIFSVENKIKPNFDMSFITKSDEKFKFLIQKSHDFFDVADQKNAGQIKTSSGSTGRTGSQNSSMVASGSSEVMSDLDSGTSSMNSPMPGVNAGSTKTKPKIPKTLEEIEESWKIATTELAADDDMSDGVEDLRRRNIEVSMALCPFNKIPKSLLPICSSDDESSSEEEEVGIEVIG